jgi:hypothetical protein
MIEIRYAGVVVGRSSAVRELDGEGLFVAIPEPLPVGTPVVLGIEEHAVAAQVQTVLESPDPVRSGMRVRFLEPGGAARLGLSVAPVDAQVQAGPGGPASPSPLSGAIPGAPAASSSSSAASATGLVTEPEDSEVGTEPVGADSGPVFSSEPGGVSSDPPGGGSEPAGPAAGGPPRRNRRNRRR